jgi:hypothetical protein
MIGSILITHKFYTDLFFCNSLFAALTNLSLQEINDIEIEFLYQIDFNLTVGKSEYEEYHEGIVTFIHSEQNK